MTPHDAVCCVYLGIKEADEEELKQMSSTPHVTHVYTVPNFDMIKAVEKSLITHVCSSVEDQLNSLISGEEGKHVGLKRPRKNQSS